MRYKNVLCVYPYKKEVKTIGFFPPLGLEYIASSIENLVESIKIIDMRRESKPLSSFIDDKTDLVLVSHNWGLEEEFVKTVINSIPKDITVVVGGRHATIYVNELFENMPRIDGIVRGDGEEIIGEIVQKGLSTDIDGLSFKPNGKVIHNRNRKLKPIQGDFYPNRKLRRYKYTISVDEFDSGIEIDLISASRGCPFNCKFCDFSTNPLGKKRGWSCRTPESVVEEIKSIEAGVIVFVDDLFTHDLGWVERICDLLIKERVKKKYIINTRVSIAERPDILKKMYKAGFIFFMIGIESAQDKTLKAMNKGFTVKKIREYFTVLRRFNFIYNCYFIIGNIGETRDEMLEITGLSHGLGMDTIVLSLLRVSKYSPLIDEISRLDNYHIEEASGTVYSDMLSVKELKRIRRDVNASFFTLPAVLRLFKKLVIHRFVTLGLVSRIFFHIARKKIQSYAKKSSPRLRPAVKDLTPRNGDVKIPGRVYGYLRRLTEKYPQIESIWLFGSRANNIFKDDSDWDVWIFSNRKILELLKENQSLKQESKLKGIDTMIVYNGENFENPWPEWEKGTVITKQGLLSEWKWEQTSALKANYEGTKNISSKEFAEKQVNSVEERPLKAFKIWGHENNLPVWFCSVIESRG